jgi:hypothetical protein
MHSWFQGILFYGKDYYAYSGEDMSAIKKTARIAYYTTTVLIYSLFIGCTASGATPLESASASGDLKKVKSLISQGTDVNAVDEDTTWVKTPLFAAAERGQDEVVAYLLEHGADVTITSAALATPLRAAAYKGHAKTVNLLLAHGANPDKDTDSSGRTPMIWAILAARGGNTSSYINIIKALHTAGAKCVQSFSSPIDDSPISVLTSARKAGDEVANVFMEICPH